MTLDQWKAKYWTEMSTPEGGGSWEWANQRTWLEVLDHSIRKWEGLQEDALKGSGLAFRGMFLGEVRPDDLGDPGFIGDLFEVCDVTCSLCVRTGAPDSKGEYMSGSYSCVRCPIKNSPRHNCIPAYTTATEDDNPAPMLALLKKTRKWLVKHPEFEGGGK